MDATPGGEQRGGDRHLLAMKRAVTCTFLVPIAVYSRCSRPGGLLIAIVATVACLCFREYAEISGLFAPLGYVAGLLILIPKQQEFVLIVVSALAAMCLPLFADNVEKGVARSAVMVLGIVYHFRIMEDGLLLHDIIALADVRRDGELDRRYRGVLRGKNFGRTNSRLPSARVRVGRGAAASAVTGIAFGVIISARDQRNIFSGCGIARVWRRMSRSDRRSGRIGDQERSRREGQRQMLPGHGGWRIVSTARCSRCCAVFPVDLCTLIEVPERCRLCGPGESCRFPPDRLTVSSCRAIDRSTASFAAAKILDFPTSRGPFPATFGRVASKACIRQP